MHSHTHQITLGFAFFLGAVHALEPGHGKTAMLVYLSHQRRGVLHPLLMGISSAASHSFSLIAIAFLVHAAQYAVTGSSDNAPDTVQFWLRAISSVLVMGVGIWMLFGTRNSGSESASNCSCSHHKTEQQSDCDEAPADATAPRSGYSASVMLGAAFGLLPCPTAVAAYLTGMAHGSAVEAYTSIALFAFEIATSLTLVGIAVQRFGNLLTGRSGRLSKLPWGMMRAVLVMLVGVGSGLSLLLQ